MAMHNRLCKTKKKHNRCWLAHNRLSDFFLA